jgi:hypothetical protein
LGGDGGAEVALIDDGDDAFWHGGIVPQNGLRQMYGYFEPLPFDLLNMNLVGV